MKKEMFNCLAVRDKILKESTEAIKNLKFKPMVLILQVGENEASNRYVKNKKKKLEECGASVTIIKVPDSISQVALENLLVQEQKKVNAIILQLPLPKHLNEQRLLGLIDPNKDADGLTVLNQGLLHTAHSNAIAPATPLGILNLFNYYNIDLSGMNVLLIGRSVLCNRSLHEMMLQKDATVTIAHTKTKDLQEMVESGRYDCIVSAIGKPHIIKNAKAKYLIDVGISFNEEGKMCGDFCLETSEFDYATSTPRGTGALTASTIIQNVIKCCNLQAS